MIRQVGAVTISGHAGGHALSSETYRQAGTFTYTRDLPANWLQPGANRIDFAVDKFIHDPAGRDLAVVVVSASLEALR